MSPSAAQKQRRYVWQWVARLGVGPRGAGSRRASGYSNARARRARRLLFSKRTRRVPAGRGLHHSCVRFHRPICFICRRAGVRMITASIGHRRCAQLRGSRRVQSTRRESRELPASRFDSLIGSCARPARIGRLVHRVRSPQPPLSECQKVTNNRQPKTALRAGTSKARTPQHS